VRDDEEIDVGVLLVEDLADLLIERFVRDVVAEHDRRRGLRALGLAAIDEDGLAPSLVKRWHRRIRWRRHRGSEARNSPY
jgi:hypothetical protein